MGTLVGYRFKPKDEEIIALLNQKKIDPDFCVQTINEVDIYNFEPSDLPRLSAIQSDEHVWYFFCTPYYKYANSKRANRKTNMGYWKLTGRGCKIYAKHSRELIGCKRYLTFCEYGNASKKNKAEWVMHEFRSQCNSPHTTDFVICRIERKTQNKPKISTGDDGQSSQHLAPNFRNHVAENNFLRVEIPQLFSHLRMANDFRNHVAENGFLTVEPQLPSHHLQFDSRNHIAEKSIQGVEHEELAYMTSNYRNHVVENIFPMVESQQLPSHYSMSDFRDQVAEHSFSGGESLLFAQYADGLNYNSLPALESPVNPEWGLSSYSVGFSDCNVLNFQFDDRQEDVSSQLTVQDKCPLEESGRTISPGVNSSKSVTVVHFGDSSGTDWETLNAWVNG